MSFALGAFERASELAWSTISYGRSLVPLNRWATDAGIDTRKRSTKQIIVTFSGWKWHSRPRKGISNGAFVDRTRIQTPALRNLWSLCLHDRWSTVDILCVPSKRRPTSPSIHIVPTVSPLLSDERSWAFSVPHVNLWTRPLDANLSTPPHGHDPLDNMLIATQPEMPASH